LSSPALPLRKRSFRTRPLLREYGAAFVIGDRPGWAVRLEDWSRHVEVLAYFNNDWEVFAVRNALRLKELLAV
jgi:hypothetical protein